MTPHALKNGLILLLAALLVGAAVYGLARLLGSPVYKAQTLGLTAVVVGVLEKPLVWVLRRFCGRQK